MPKRSIDALRAAIRNLHGCDSLHVESVELIETWSAQVVCGGVVEVFDLIDHPTAERAYAWARASIDDLDKGRYVAMLHAGPVVSPQTAVAAAIVQEYRERGR